MGTGAKNMNILTGVSVLGQSYYNWIFKAAYSTPLPLNRQEGCLDGMI